MVKARKYVVKKIFSGVPKKDDFEVVEHELPPLADEDILVKAEYISVDPYQRAYNKSQTVPYDQFGYQIGEVVESKNSKYPVGTKIVSHRGWCDYTILNPKSTGFSDSFYKLPNIDGLPLTVGLGAIGMTGASAYFGFLEICKPKAGETVVVSGAAGAVGSIVGQIAKIKGCKVIGFAGSNDKVEWLEKELGFDKALNYKTVDAASALKEAAPNGVDCYFDNVGGELSSVIISQMNIRGRVSVCGSISSYNDESLPKATIVQPYLVFKELQIEGFLIWRWAGKWDVAFVDLVKWIKSGQLKSREHVTEGFDQLFNAFVGLFAGDNTGKSVVKV